MLKAKIGDDVYVVEGGQVTTAPTPRAAHILSLAVANATPSYVPDRDGAFRDYMVRELDAEVLEFIPAESVPGRVY